MRAVGHRRLDRAVGAGALFYAPAACALARSSSGTGCWPLWFAAAWVAIEVWRSGWPFSGMPWGRLAFASSTPRRRRAAVGRRGRRQLPARAERHPARLAGRRPGRGRGEPRWRRSAWSALVALLAVPALAPWTADGRPRGHRGRGPGRRARQRRRHPRRPPRGHPEPRRRDRRLAARSTAGRGAAAGLRGLAGELHRRRPVRRRRDQRRDPRPRAGDRRTDPGRARSSTPGTEQVLNQGIVWDPETGAGDRYTKRHPVPFGEYIPLRAVFTTTTSSAGSARSAATCSAAPARAARHRRACRSPTRSASTSPTTTDLTAQVAQRRRAAHRADQQRDVHPHRPDRPAVRDHPAAGDRDRPLGRGRLDQRRLRASSRPTAGGRHAPTRAPRRCWSSGSASTSQLTPAMRIGPWLGRVCVALTGCSAVLAGRCSRIVGAGSSDGRPGEDAPARELEPTSTGEGHDRRRALGRVVMVIPTYNEADNLAWIVGRLRAAQPGGRRAGRRRQLARRHRRDRRRARRRRPRGARPAPDREGRPGRGVPRTASRGRSTPATTSSARWTPTAPTSPSSCTGCSTALRDADLVIGSRWVPGGSVVNWPLRREVLSRGGNLYVRLLLGIDGHATPPPASGCSGAPPWRRSTSASVQSTGYVFQTDLVTRTLAAGLTVREVPIEFVERERGDSKMSGAVASESLRRITALGAARAPRPGAPGAAEALARWPPAPIGAAAGCWSSLFVVVPLVEIYVLIQVGQVIGALVDDPAAGRRQPPRRLADQARGRPGLAGAARGARQRPDAGPELADGALILVGGTLMLTPGLRHRRVRDPADPAVHPAGRPAAADRRRSRRRLVVTVGRTGPDRSRRQHDAPDPALTGPWSRARSSTT